MQDVDVSIKTNSMKALLYSLFILYSFNPLNGQIPFAPVGAKYWLQGVCDQGSHSYAREISRDTVIQGKYCTIIDMNLGAGVGFSPVCDGGWPVFSGNIVHSDGYKVYVYDEIDTVFHLLYDFSKSTGEFYKIKTCEEAFGIDSVTIEVKEVENYIFNGTPMVRQLLRCTPENITPGYWSYFETYVYEGIGGDKGNILLFPDILTTIHCVTHLLCYWSPITDEVIIGNVSSPCVFVNSDEVENNAFFSVFPNPSNGNVTLQYELSTELSNTSIYLYNNIGQCQYTFKLNSHFGQKEVNNLPAGVYFITMMSEGQIIKSEKLIVTH